MLIIETNENHAKNRLALTRGQRLVRRHRNDIRTRKFDRSVQSVFCVKSHDPVTNREYSPKTILFCVYYDKRIRYALSQCSNLENEKSSTKPCKKNDPVQKNTPLSSVVKPFFFFYLSLYDLKKNSGKNSR